MLRLVFLGKFRHLAPPTLESAAPPPGVVTLEDLRQWVGRQEPALGAALAVTPFRLIVNHRIVQNLSVRFHPLDEIAFMPPMSGG
jgi:molybdopterin converting factor small subunit